MKMHRIALVLAASIVPVTAQVPDSGSNNTTIVNQQPEQNSQSMLGRDVPMIDPGSEVAVWDGKAWNITNNRLFRARFEKYLAEPESDSEADRQYRAELEAVLKALSPARAGGPDLREAISHMLRASVFPDDSHICDSLLNAVYGVSLSKKQEKALDAANKAIEAERRRLELNVEVASEHKKLSNNPTPAGGSGTGGNRPNNGGGNGGTQPTNGGGTAATPTTGGTEQFTRLGGYTKRILEIDAMRLANMGKQAINEVKAKVEFQAMIVTLLGQRRFEHVVMATRLYRVLFNDGDNELQIKEGSDAEKMFAKGLGVNPTIATLDSLANEAIGDVEKGVKAFLYLSDKDELDSASQRLSEAFVVGEYLPAVRKLPRAKKDKVLEFVRDSYQLVSTLEVKDYTTSEILIEKLRKSSKDFDSSKPKAAVESARAGSDLHIQAARLAASEKKMDVVQTHIRQAAEIWPTNPALKEFSKQASEFGNMNARILADFEDLVARKNYRQIFDDQIKYGAVVLGNPEKEAKLKEVVAIVFEAEKALMQGEELVKRGDNFGAWESIHEALKKSPDDAKLNKLSATLSSKVSSFVEALDKARSLEEKGEYGPSLAWYLKAKKEYPVSRLTKEGLERTSNALLPETIPTATGLPAPTSTSSAFQDLPAPTNTQSSPPPPAPSN